MRSGVNTDILYRYTGQEFDAESGLHNFRARLYDDELLRFYATDPLGQAPSPFLYAGNNPIIFVDPDGRLWKLFLAYVGLKFIYNEIVGPQLSDPTKAGLNNDLFSPGYYQNSIPRAENIDRFGSLGNYRGEMYHDFANQKSDYIWKSTYLGMTPYDPTNIVELTYPGRKDHLQWVRRAKRARGLLRGWKNTVLGLGLVAGNWLINREPRFVGIDTENLVVGFKNTWFPVPQWFPLFEGSSYVTFGHVVLANHPWTLGFEHPAYALHELVHVSQYDIFGHNFLPICLKNWVANLAFYWPVRLITGYRINPYEDILFEIQAYYLENPWGYE